MSGKASTLTAGILIGVLLSVSLLLFPRLGWAPPLIKMGVVNWEQVVMQYNAYQTELKELERRRKRVLNFIDQESKKINGGQKDQEMESIYKDTLKQIRERREQTIKRYHQRIYDSIEAEAIEQGYSLILSENEVLYASEEYADLTNAVIERLNNGDTG